jgi:hypothetical protein
MKAAIVVIVLAAVGYYAWSHYFSREAKVERAYQSCVSKMSAGIEKAKGSASQSGDKNMQEAMNSMMQGIGDAMCGMIKEACKQDYNGQVCQAAISSANR